MSFKPHWARTGILLSQLLVGFMHCKANNSANWAWLSMIPHCLEWYKLLLHICLSTSAVQYLVQCSILMFFLDTVYISYTWVELMRTCAHVVGVRGRWRHAGSSQHCSWPDVVPIQSVLTESCLDQRCRMHATASHWMCRIHRRSSHYQQS